MQILTGFLLRACTCCIFVPGRYSSSLPYSCNIIYKRATREPDPTSAKVSNSYCDMHVCWIGGKAEVCYKMPAAIRLMLQRIPPNPNLHASLWTYITASILYSTRTGFTTNRCFSISNALICNGPQHHGISFLSYRAMTEILHKLPKVICQPHELRRSMDIFGSWKITNFF